MITLKTSTMKKVAAIIVIICADLFFQFVRAAEIERPNMDISYRPEYRTMEGVWKVMIIPALYQGVEPAHLITYKVFSKGGIAINTDGTGGVGVGVWKRLSIAGYMTKFVQPANLEALSVASTSTMLEIVTLSEKGHAFKGTYTDTFTDEDGNVLMILEGELRGERIMISADERSYFLAQTFNQ
ncbi:hypothetical protein [Flocculibacter collagenilyticus]|uniref:hypothetical protein n=1 Tax=Flocculibacter collagenilyticus TaxID=2744479 RepID=UPI0018F6A591|nr:hypothetical protein [Flocculibacter collagenilyticus]